MNKAKVRRRRRKERDQRWLDRGCPMPENGTMGQHRYNKIHGQNELAEKGRETPAFWCRTGEIPRFALAAQTITECQVLERDLISQPDQ